MTEDEMKHKVDSVFDKLGTSRESNQRSSESIRLDRFDTKYIILGGLLGIPVGILLGLLFAGPINIFSTGFLMRCLLYSTAGMLLLYTMFPYDRWLRKTLGNLFGVTIEKPDRVWVISSPCGRIKKIFMILLQYPLYMLFIMTVMLIGLYLFH
ncbi:MAG: hypothetical protein HZB59_02815 [Ignavibacteriales bacterium]|nr:hypothetical protein [Ignavibacteriales bacterium]